MKERYGWDKYKKEGLAELARIKSSKHFSGEDELISLIEKYIKFYGDDWDLKTKIVGTTFYPTIVKNKGKKSARDKSTKQIGKLKHFIKNFYDSAEGNDIEYEIYFFTKSRDYRLGIRKIESNGEKTMTAHTLSGAIYPSPSPVVTLRQPCFVVDSWDDGSSKAKYVRNRKEDEIYITIINAGVAISQLKVSSFALTPEQESVISCEPKTMPQGATALLKLNSKRIFSKKSHLLYFEYVTVDGFPGIQQYYCDGELCRLSLKRAGSPTLHHIYYPPKR